MSGHSLSTATKRKRCSTYVTTRASALTFSTNKEGKNKTPR